MDLLPDEDQQALVDSIAGMLRDVFPVEAARWRRGSDLERLGALADLGCYGLGIPEAQGGSGLGPAEETMLFAQLGRHLAPPAALAAVLGARLAVAAGATDLAAAIVSGDTQVAMAFQGGGGRSYLVDAAEAPFILHVSEAAAWLLPAAAATGRTRHESLDETVVLESANLDVDAAGGLRQDGPALARLRDLLVAALLVGLAESALALGVGYAQVREQFGQPIGAFQAIKHPLARSATRADAARWSCMLAALSLAEGQNEAAFQIKAALLVAADTASSTSAIVVQVHGGMGYTAECAVHYHVKRAQLLQRLVGGLASQRDEFLVLPPPAMIRGGVALASH